LLSSVKGLYLQKSERVSVTVTVTART